MILLTHAGIEEMERSRLAPDQATEHFPPISVIHVEGDAIGSVIQVGSPRNHQAVSIGDLNLDTVREIVGEFEACAISPCLTVALMQQPAAAASLPRPGSHRIQSCTVLAVTVASSGPGRSRS